MLDWIKKAQKKLAERPPRVEARRSAVRLRKRFFELQEKLQPDAFIEIGAFDGTTSIEMRRILPRARIVAFEANPHNYVHFRAEFSHSESGVEYINAAVARTPGEITFRVLDRHHGKVNPRGSILSTERHPDTVEATVPAVSLDDFFASSMPIRPSVWIDVEGASGEVLSGGREILSRAGSVFIEVEEERRWKEHWLAPQVVTFLEEHGLIPLDRDSEYGQQYNILFVRAEYAR